jgi:15-cis-phytoene synthase
LNRSVFYKLRKDIQFCKKINKQYGKTYYLSSIFFPKNLRIATYIVYAFFRIPDEIVDNGDPKNAEQELKKWVAQWQMAYKHKQHEDPVLNATSYIFHKYSIPYEYSESFLKSMLMDLKKKTYASYKDLEVYMYGSAGVVGKIMTYLIGYKDKKALIYAQQLGYAMQLTNFLRDIKEDIDKRERVYLPTDELSNYKLSIEDILSEKVNADYISFMKFQIQRARKLYKYSLEGLQHLNTKGKLAVLVSVKLYSAILKEIENNNYNVFDKTISIPFLKKIMIIIFTRISYLVY